MPLGRNRINGVDVRGAGSSGAQQRGQPDRSRAHDGDRIPYFDMAAANRVHRRCEGLDQHRVLAFQIRRNFVADCRRNRA